MDRNDNGSGPYQDQQRARLRQIDNEIADLRADVGRAEARLTLLRERRRDLLERLNRVSGLGRGESGLSRPL